MATVARGNLDRRSQDAQLRVGLVALALALAVAVALGQSGAARGLRAIAFVPFLVAAYGIVAALYGVCGITALAGRRRTAEGAERVADRFELRAQRVLGLRVILVSAALAAAATVPFLVD